MFGFLGNIVSATVKVAVAPLAVVKDVVDGEPGTTTGAVLDSAKDDVGKAFEDLME